MPLTGKEEFMNKNIINTILGEAIPTIEDWLRNVVADEVRRTIEDERKKARPECYLSRIETAKTLKVSLVTLWKLTRAGEIKSTNIGRSVKYAESEIKRFQEGK